MESFPTHSIPIAVEKTPSQRPQRLRTLHSILYPEHQPANIPSGTISSAADLESRISEYHRVGPSSDRRTVYSSSTNLTHGFIAKPKINPLHEAPRQISSWDDI